MYKYIVRLVERILDIHICMEHTQWEDKECDWKRPVEIRDFIADWDVKEIVHTKRWQERKCTICGKIQQRRLKY